MSSDVVTVACKYQPGLILQICENRDELMPVPHGEGTKAVKVWRPTGPSFKVHGPNTKDPDILKVGGYALTPGVPADLWEEWSSQHRDSDLVVNRLIFAYPKAETVRDVAKENRTSKSGLEPLDMRTVLKGDRRVVADLRIPRAGDMLVETATADR